MIPLPACPNADERRSDRLSRINKTGPRTIGIFLNKDI